MNHKFPVWIVRFDAGALFSAILFVLCACNSLSFAQHGKEKYLNNYTAFVNDVKANRNAYKDNDWENADKRFWAFIGKEYSKFEKEFTDDEKKKINELTGRYAAYRAINATKSIIDYTGDQVKNAASFTKGFIDAAREALNDSTGAK